MPIRRPGFDYFRDIDGFFFDNPKSASSIQTRPVPRVIEVKPVPQSNFINATQSRMNAPNAMQNTMRQGALAQKLLTMHPEKNKAIEDQKIAVLEAKYVAQVKKAEEAAKKKLEEEKRKAEIAQDKAREAAEKREKRRYDTELTKKARIETRKIIVETKKEIAKKRCLE